MNRSAAARALLAAAAVLAAGLFAARALLGGGSAPPASVYPPPAVVPAMESGSPIEPASPPPAAPRALAGLTVTNVTGPVERRAAPGEPWRPVHAGESIALNESLRTGSGGAALLELQDHTTIWIWPESEVSAERLDDELERVAFTGGRLDLSVPANAGRSVEVAAQGGATAVTQGARFSIIVDGAHVATVATREGEVDVVSGNGRVRVPPGMQTRARPGAAPEVITPIPTELLLQVDWPALTQRARSAVLHGRAPAGVLVSVGGTRVVVGEDGTFTQEVPLQEGDNRVEVVAEDVVGRRAVRRSPPIRVDTHAPTVRAVGHWE